MRAFAEAWPDSAIVQQAVGQFPWGHNKVLLTGPIALEWRLVDHHNLQTATSAKPKQAIKLNLRTVDHGE